MPKLALRHVSKNFGAAVAVDDLTLDLDAGEFVSLLGPSGCGKTTTLRMIAGFIQPSGGVIEMDGEILSSASTCRPPERRRMSMIFQSYAIWPNMTVFENVAFGLKLRKLPGAEVRRKVDAVLDVARMRDLRDRYPAELSGGQQQRVALARAIVVQPEILLLDEPLSNLDANLREEMRFEIRRLHDEFRITTVYVTHDQAEAMVTSDRIVVMNQGRIEQVDDPFTLYNRPRTRFVANFIGRTNLLSGRIAGEAIDFDGFSVPAALLPASPQRADGAVLFSVRPQSIRVHLRDGPNADNGRWWLPAQICERAYLGDSWDYIVVPANSQRRLRVSSPPEQVFERAEHVWLEIDPELVVAIPE
ncbi:MAG TPA: ABC transporter ATP-binding protein [Stellaceae bacterium]|nr:ABC transporter ATP-binding protein [Stellaceae bacterium]